MTDTARKMGPPLLLSADREKQLVDATTAGVPVDIAAAAAGISRTTFLRWLQYGREEEAAREDGEAADETKEPYLELWRKVAQARAQAASRSVIQIQRVAAGGIVTEESVKTYRDPETGAVVKEETVKRTAPDWRAAAWYLEKQARNHFGKEGLQVELTGADGGPLEVASVDAEQLADRLTANIKALAAGTAAAAIEAANSTDEPVDGEVVDEVLDAPASE